MSLPRYSYCLYPVPLGPQYLSYLNFLDRFYNSIEDSTKKDVLIRLHKSDYGWNQVDRWRKISQNVIFDTNTSLLKTINSSKLVVVTYNATTLVEMIFWNKPTVILLEKEFWELNEESKVIYKKLSDCSILHYSPEECSKFIHTIWHEIDKWWLSNKVQNAIEEFRNIYSLRPSYKKI